MKVMKAAVANSGSLDIVVDNAGTLVEGAIAETTDQMWRRQMVVNAAVLGFVTTEMTAIYDGAIRDVLTEQTPRGVWASPQGVANCVVFLASPMSYHSLRGERCRRWRLADRCPGGGSRGRARSATGCSSRSVAG